MKKSMKPAEGKERFPAASDPLVELRKLRDYLQGKSRNVEEMNRESETILSDIDQKRLETAQHSIRQRKDLIFAIGA